MSIEIIETAMGEMCNSCKKFNICNEKIKHSRSIKCIFEPTEEILRLPGYSEEQMNTLLNALGILR